MKTLNDFKNENQDLEKLEMAGKIGGLNNPTRELTAESDENWNCGDTTTCVNVAVGNWICVTTQNQG